MSSMYSALGCRCNIQRAWTYLQHYPHGVIHDSLVNNSMCLDNGNAEFAEQVITQYDALQWKPNYNYCFELPVPTVLHTYSHVHFRWMVGCTFIKIDGLEMEKGFIHRSRLWYRSFVSLSDHAKRQVRLLVTYFKPKLER